MGSVSQNKLFSGFSTMHSTLSSMHSSTISNVAWYNKFADATFAASRPLMCGSPIGCDLLLKGCGKVNPALSKSLCCVFLAAEQVPQGGAKWIYIYIFQVLLFWCDEIVQEIYIFSFRQVQGRYGPWRPRRTPVDCNCSEANCSCEPSRSWKNFNAKQVIKRCSLLI